MRNEILYAKTCKILNYFSPCTLISSSMLIKIQIIVGLYAKSILYAYLIPESKYFALFRPSYLPSISINWHSTKFLWTPLNDSTPIVCEWCQTSRIWISYWRNFPLPPVQIDASIFWAISNTKPTKNAKVTIKTRFDWLFFMFRIIATLIHNVTYFYR